jgi:hypothetical protein
MNKRQQYIKAAEDEAVCNIKNVVNRLIINPQYTKEQNAQFMVELMEKLETQFGPALIRRVMQEIAAEMKKEKERNK